jgi:tetratricopeptide (TPR) repeat protein
MALGEQPVEWLDWSEAEEDDENALPHIDRRAMERAMALLTREVSDQTEFDDPALARAQDLMYQAWEETNPAKRIALAHDALVVSANCADAYVLLAEDEADTLNRALELYQEGVAAGERALGAKYFKRNAGHFWGLLETRPYMRARAGLARTLWRVKRYDEAIAHYRELLRLNPGDNQGNRYALLDLLLQIEHDDDARALLAQYREEWSALWLYSRALLEFRAHGASARANKILRDALEENPYAPAYLSGDKRLPNRRLDSYGWGDESEAIYYVSEHLNYWRRTPGAVEWLSAQLKVRPAPPRKRRRR